MDCPKTELLSLHLRNIGFLGIGLNLGLKIRYTNTIIYLLDGNKTKSSSPDGRRFHCLL
jgi:hypothetical protein